MNAKGTAPQKLRLATGDVLLADDVVPAGGGIAVEQVEFDIWLICMRVVDKTELVRAIAAIAPVGEVLDSCVTPFRDFAVQPSGFRQPRNAAFGSALNDR